MKFKNILWILIVLGLIVAVSGCTSTENNSTQSKEADLKIVNSSLVHTEDMFYSITGYLKNEGDTDYSYIELRFKVFDKNGNIIYTDMEPTSLAPGETWKFDKQFGLNEKPGNYTVTIDTAE